MTPEAFITLDQLIELKIIPVPRDTLYRWTERLREPGEEG